MRRWTRLLLPALLLAILAACGGVDTPAPEPASRPDIRATGRALLFRGEDETQGYGLYSYLLFGSRPANDTQRKRYLAVIEAYLRRLEDIGEVESSSRINRSELNVTYLPVTAKPPPAPSAEQLLASYDFPRALALLSLFEGDLLAGPYILSYREPLGGLRRAEAPCIFQDLSGVPESVANLWMSEFLKEARQGGVGESGGGLERIALRIRTRIAQIAALVPDLVAGVDEAAAIVDKLSDDATSLAVLVEPKAGEG